MIEIVDHDIGPAVIIEVTDGTAAPAAVVVHAVGRHDIRKSEVPVIAEEPVGLATIHEIDIEIAVIVEVEGSDSLTASRVGDACR